MTDWNLLVMPVQNQVNGRPRCKDITLKFEDISQKESKSAQFPSLFLRKNFSEKETWKNSTKTY